MNRRPVPVWLEHVNRDLLTCAQRGLVCAVIIVLVVDYKVMTSAAAVLTAAANQRDQVEVKEMLNRVFQRVEDDPVELARRLGATPQPVFAPKRCRPPAVDWTAIRASRQRIKAAQATHCYGLGSCPTASPQPQRQP